MHPIQPWTRREFVGCVTTGALMAGASAWSRPALALTGAHGSAGRAGPSNDVAALVHWVREVAREKMVAELVDRVKKGLTAEQLLAAIFLAGIWDVEPRPVGFKFHCVLQMPAVWRVATALPEAERVLPLVYALAVFKQSQAAARHNDWLLAAPDESALPKPEKARAALVAACDAWDLEAADAAVTALARAGDRAEMIAALLPYGMRSFADVGHHPIFTNATFRVLDLIGWQHAEPVLRCLVYGLLSPGPTDAAASFEKSRAEAATLVKEGFPQHYGPISVVTFPLTRATMGATNAAAIAAMLTKIRGLSLDERAIDLCFLDLELLALELLMENPGLLAVHATTSIRALRELATRTDDPALKLTALLQGAAWCPPWRAAFGGPKGDPEASSWRKLAKDARDLRESGAETPQELLQQHGSRDRRELAVALTRTLSSASAKRDFLTETRRLLVAKGREAHDYKFFAAMEEAHGDPPFLSGDAPDALLAVLTYYLRGPKENDFAPVAEARAALAS